MRINPMSSRYYANLNHHNAATMFWTNVGTTEKLRLPKEKLGQTREEYSLYIIRLHHPHKATVEPIAYSHGNDTWTLVAFNSANVHTFSIRDGMTREDGPYTHTHTVNQRIKRNSRDATGPVRVLEDGEDVLPVGPLLGKYFPLLTALFFNTEAGPNQYFMGRFLDKVKEAGWLEVEDDLVRQLSVEATYSPFEFDKVGEDGFLPVDQAFIDKWDYVQE